MPMTPQELIENLGTLPPLPQVATQAVRISADSDTSSEDLQKLISRDQALSAQVLKIANSAMFGRMREVTTLTQAIMTLGFSTARSVVLAASIKNLFSRGNVAPEERALWEHALVAALLGGAVSQSLGHAMAEEVFLAGLMHDIGKSVLALKFPESYGALLRRINDQDGDGLALETAAFGFDHAMVGEALLHSWNISEGIEAVARWHHAPLQAPAGHHRLVALVSLGNHVAHDLRTGFGKSSALAEATWAALTILKLDDASFQSHRAAALEALERDRTLVAEF